ncbi:MAG: hypothetical protein JWP40_981 [Blastococcus sp.]|nr:hypothetical protein [Blastococcus sp.]
MPSDMLVLTEKAAAKAYADGYDAGRRSSAAAEDPAD